MNTLARSLDALIGPAKNKRGRKRDIAAMEGVDGDSETTSKAIYKRLRMMTAMDDTAEHERQASISGTASFASNLRVASGTVLHINQLAAKQQPLETLNFSRLETSTLPPAMDALITKVRRCAKGINTIPMSLKEQVLDRDPDLYPDDNVWQLNASLLAEIVPSQPTANADTVPTLALSDTPASQPQSSCEPSPHARNRPLSFHEAEMIVEQARECSDNDDLEVGWNSLVHGPLLLLACNVSQHRAKVKSANLTHARLIPRLGAHGHAVSTGEMVDFGIYLKNSDQLKAAYKDIQPEADGQSRYFNHTDLEQIARKPLVISIETQREGQRGSQTELQLSLWAKSHLNRLSELRGRTLNSDDRTIWLPLLKTVGPIWYLALARGEYSGSGELSGTTIYSRHQLGDITTYHGFFQVLSALLELIDWTETFYRPWFEDWVSSDYVIGEGAA
jgi:hypothetical protein